MNIYLSPSTQERNIGAGSYGTEEKRMNQLADIVEPRLKQHGFTVYRNSPTMTLSQVIADSNKKIGKNGIHVAPHTNAGGGVGTEVWYYTGSTNGQRLAQCIYDEVAPITPSKDRGIKHTKQLGEVANTLSIAIILEVIFHDNQADADYMINHMQEVAEAIVRGICKYAGVTYKSIHKPVQAPQTAKKGLYKVQVGAFGEKANAERLAVELQSKGYKTYIVQE